MYIQPKSKAARALMEDPRAVGIIGSCTGELTGYNVSRMLRIAGLSGRINTNDPAFYDKAFNGYRVGPEGVAASNCRHILAKGSYAGKNRNRFYLLEVN